MFWAAQNFVINEGFDAFHKYMMRISEVISHIKPIKPMTPAQARVHALKQSVERSRQKLQAERDRQRRQRDSERQHKLRQQTDRL